MIRNNSSNASTYILNFLPIHFNNKEIRGELLQYSTKEDFRSLQDSNNGKWLCKRAGKRIQAVPLIADAQTLSGEQVIFSASKDWSLYERLIEEGVRRDLKSLYPSYIISNYGEVLLKITGEGSDIVEDALRNLRPLPKKFPLGIRRLYHFEAAFFRENASEQPDFGLRIKLSTSWEINLSIEELAGTGIDLVGCYVVPSNLTSPGRIGNKVLGAIREIREGKVYLDDARDVEFVDAKDHTVEASLENVDKILDKILGTQSKVAAGSIRREVARFLGAEGQQKRIVEMGESLAKQPIVCAHGLSATIGTKLQEVNLQARCSPLVFEEPKYLLKYDGPSISGPIATALDAEGPFDRDSFKKTNPYILVITPKQCMGHVEQFLKKWRDGGLKRPYAEGFLRKYFLRGCDFHFVDFEVTTAGSPADYEKACLKALQDSKEKIKRYDLAFVVIREKHRLWGANDPYLIAKATLMSQGVPTQALEIETISTPIDHWPFILNNVALAAYAKMGGTPWTLATPKGEGINHEVIMGLGSATLGTSRLGHKERYVGIATVFNCDGFYLLSKTSREATLEEYPEALKSALVSSLERVSERKGWRPGDRVRLIFHTFKPLKNIEIEAVKSLVNNHLKQFKVDFAFLVIGDQHNWMMYDPNSIGFETKYSSVRGGQVPWRGSSVVLNEHEILVAVTGPKEIKFTDQGAPAPLRVFLNGASTFCDLKYLAEQVFDFTYMSWKTFSLQPLPVTISYSDMVARLLGRLRHVRNWNSNALETTELSDSLWFL